MRDDIPEDVIVVVKIRHHCCETFDYENDTPIIVSVLILGCDSENQLGSSRYVDESQLFVWLSRVEGSGYLSSGCWNIG